MNAVYSELHSRLNHMVNYSSQLIFVSSDTIAQQQRTLELFLAEQSEQTEIAFITAHPNIEVRQYRRQLCQQLLGQVAGTFVRPLNELLESLNHHEGPILIGIMQAQELPNDFLQELWELVLQSRFAANKQHLNIVLFGQSEWAEEAQAWLPAKNTAMPLLLSSETVSAQMSELDTLIAQKRAAFHQRLAQRNQQSSPLVEQSKPLLRNPWFNLAMIACFMVFFITILWTQYPNKMAELVGVSPVQTVPKNAPTESDLVLQESDRQPPADTTDDITKQESPSNITSEPLTSQTVETSVTEQLLVSNWPTESQAENELPMDSSAAALSDAATIENVNAVEPSDISVQVADRPSVEDSPTSETPTSNDSITPAALSLPAGSFAIQLTGVSSRALAQQFIADNQLGDKTLRYETLLNGNEWHVIIFSQTFESLDAARRAIDDLPVYDRQSEPFVKSAAQIEREITRQ